MRLGTGEELSWTYDHPDLAFSRQVLTSAYLSTKDHQALLLQAALSHSDHDAAQYIILEVENGRLTEQGRRRTTLPPWPRGSSPPSLR